MSIIILPITISPTAKAILQSQMSEMLRLILKDITLEDWRIETDVQVADYQRNMSKPVKELCFKVTIDRPDFSGKFTVKKEYHRSSLLNLSEVEQL